MTTLTQTKAYNLTNIFTFDSRNGYGMDATLTINGVAVVDMSDDGDGSCPKFDVRDKKLFDELMSHLESLPEADYGYGCMCKIDLSMFFCLLHYALDANIEFTLLS